MPCTLEEELFDLFAGPTYVIQASGKMYQSSDLPRTPPRTAGLNAATPWLLRAPSQCGTSEPGSTSGRFCSSHGWFLVENK